MKWLQYVIDKLPVKWVVIFTFISIVGYFGLEFYKEHHTYKIRMAEIQRASPDKAPNEKSLTRTAVERISPRTKTSYAKGSS